jgi:hypothetical protein
MRALALLSNRLNVGGTCSETELTIRSDKNGLVLDAGGHDLQSLATTHLSGMEMTSALYMWNQSLLRT